ncbi:MAG: prepilin-type N-terminal cleavage/methylation domain [Verrucomicrobiales bacterium]|nr:prepilin-type N-terminal cleavage/methylation domain [Verrucomicrobiales bacterium]
MLMNMQFFEQVNPQVQTTRPAAFPSARAAAFTRVELLVVVGACLVLAAIQIPLLGRSREPGNVAVCANNLRQIGAAMLMFSADNDGYMTGRSYPRWPLLLLPYYRQTNVLHCPSDAAKPSDFGTGNTNYVGPRSYLFNGFNDYAGPDWGRAFSVPMRAIKYPSETILFGEKYTDSGHWWFDFNQYDDVRELEHARHFDGSISTGKGGSNYNFADGSVRLLKPGQSFQPVFLWGISDESRGWFPIF